MLFISTFINKVDRKGRVSVPATFRALLSKQPFAGVIAFRSFKEEAIECCGMDFMERMSQSLDEMAMFSDEQDDLATAIFADANQLPFDPEGRIILPKPLMDHAGIDDRAAFVGKGRTFQIWNPDIYDSHSQEVRSRAARLGRTLPGKSAKKEDG